MSDLKILEKDGHVELEDVEEAISEGALDNQALWAAVGQGDHPGAARLLLDAGWELDGAQPDQVRKVTIVKTPDDILGSFHRIWVKASK